MFINRLDWNENNVIHIARHNVEPFEVEEFCRNDHRALKEGQDRYILSGMTDAGRFLFVVLQKLDEGRYRPITAFEMSETYKRRYRKRLRQ